MYHGKMDYFQTVTYDSILVLLLQRNIVLPGENKKRGNAVALPRSIFKNRNTTPRQLLSTSVS